MVVQNYISLTTDPAKCGLRTCRSYVDIFVFAEGEAHRPPLNDNTTCLRFYHLNVTDIIPEQVLINMLKDTT